MNKIITFFNKKGGVGKTTIAFSVASHFSIPIITNDDSVLEEIYEGRAKIFESDNVPIMSKGEAVIYDLGGFVSPGVIDVFKASDMIIVPTLLDSNSIRRTINTVMELNEYCKNIVIIINRVDKATIQNFKQSINALKGLKKDILPLSDSRVFVRSTYEGKGIVELANENGLAKHNYKNVYNQFKEIIKRIEK